MRRILRHHLFRNLILALVLLILVPTLLPDKTPGIKSFDQQVLGVPGTPKVLIIDEGQKEKIYQSGTYKARFRFNAIAPHWKESGANENNRVVELRTSRNGADWSEWMEIEAVGEMKDNAPHADEVFAETPIFIGEAEYFEHRVSLMRGSAALASPVVSELVITYIDSRTPVSKKLSDNARAADQGPGIITRSGWGSPDPYGETFSGDAKWYPEYESVSQFFIHHTVNSNTSSDFPAVVRAIWQYHTYTRGWGDIGYNYLVDGNGAIYEGRFGGDNVIGGHVLGYNKGSMGVALIGCFQPGSTCNSLNGGSTPGPSSAMLNSLTTLLAYKATNYEISPGGIHNFCGTASVNYACLTIPQITGHREAQQTSCPGDLTWAQLDNIRTQTATKKGQNLWPYSAKQVDFETYSLNSTGTTDVTFTFKNTGPATWSNSSQALMITTANPPNRTTPFNHSSWVNQYTPGALDQATVAPGQNGTFTFTMSGNGAEPGTYYEYFRLFSQGNTDLHQFFIVKIEVPCSIGTAPNPRPNGMMIRSTSNGQIFLLEKGKKRYLTSPKVLETNALVNTDNVGVSSSEIAIYPSGKDIRIREGTLVTASNTPKVYIIDETATGYERRWVVNPEAMNAQGLRFSSIIQIAGGELDSYPDGASVTDVSPFPDGMLLHEDSTGKISLTEAGKKRYIPSNYALFTNGYFYTPISSQKQSEISSLENASDLRLRPGWMITSSSTSKVFAIDEDDTGYKKRWILNLPALEAAGFIWQELLNVSPAELDSYPEGSSISC